MDMVVIGKQTEIYITRHNQRRQEGHPVTMNSNAPRKMANLKCRETRAYSKNDAKVDRREECGRTCQGQTMRTTSTKVKPRNIRIPYPGRIGLAKIAQRRKRRRGKEEERQKPKENRVKVGSWNVGTMTGKGIEIVDVCKRGV